MNIPQSVLIALAAAALVTGAAHAQTAADAAAPVSKIVWTPRPAFDLSNPHAKSSDLHAKIETKTGVAAIGPTAVDHHFSPDTVGSLGYLCGLQPGPNERGGVASTFDPEGTFLGGQFKLAFK